MFGGQPDCVAGTFAGFADSHAYSVRLEPGLLQAAGERRVCSGRPHGQNSSRSQSAIGSIEARSAVEAVIGLAGQPRRAVVYIKQDCIPDWPFFFGWCAPRLLQRLKPGDLAAAIPRGVPNAAGSI